MKKKKVLINQLNNIPLDYLSTTLSTNRNTLDSFVIKHESISKTNTKNVSRKEQGKRTQTTIEEYMFKDKNVPNKRVKK